MASGVHSNSEETPWEEKTPDNSRAAAPASRTTRLLDWGINDVPVFYCTTSLPIKVLIPGGSPQFAAHKK